MARGEPVGILLPAFRICPGKAGAIVMFLSHRIPRDIRYAPRHLFRHSKYYQIALWPEGNRWVFSCMPLAFARGRPGRLSCFCHTAFPVTSVMLRATSSSIRNIPKWLHSPRGTDGYFLACLSRLPGVGRGMVMFLSHRIPRDIRYAPRHLFQHSLAFSDQVGRLAVKLETLVEGTFILLHLRHQCADLLQLQFD